MALIRIEAVWKSFERGTGRKPIFNYLCDRFRRGQRDRFYALKNVSFEIAERQSVAIIGANGAGKSTLLSLIAGLTEPDQGRVEINGQMATLLELGTGFHPDLTGFENLLLNASLLGFSRKQATKLCSQILEFADVGDFLGEPIRTYSSGMVLRLAFSIAIHLDPVILVVDEILAVGDAAFQKRCIDKIHEFRQRGKSLLCVTHSSAAVLQLCDRAIWLDRGELMADGEAQETLKAYQKYVDSLLKAETMGSSLINSYPRQAAPARPPQFADDRPVEFTAVMSPDKEPTARASVLSSSLYSPEKV